MQPSRRSGCAAWRALDRSRARGGARRDPGPTTLELPRAECKAYAQALPAGGCRRKKGFQRCGSPLATAWVGRACVSLIETPFQRAVECAACGTVWEPTREEGKRGGVRETPGRYAAGRRAALLINKVDSSWMRQSLLRVPSFIRINSHAAPHGHRRPAMTVRHGRRKKGRHAV